MNDIEIGEINHSREFAQKFVSSVHDVLVSREIEDSASNPLPTVDVSLIVMLGDKVTVRRDVTQPTVICKAFVGEQNPFPKYYLSHRLLRDHP